MALSSTFSNVFIDGNSFDDGYATSDGTSSTLYAYDNMVLTSADANISNNFFHGINTNTSTNTMISITGASCSIIGNTFVRASSGIKAYIFDTTSTIDQVITNNIFDSNTVNGSDDDVVKGLTIGSLYTNNKNQTGYVLVPILDGEKSWDAASFSFINSSSGSSISTSTDPVVLQTHSLNVYGHSILQDASQHFYVRVFNLDKYLPPSAQITEVKWGVYYVLDGTNSLDTGLDSGTPRNLLSMYLTGSNVDKNAVIDAKNRITDVGVNSVLFSAKSIISPSDVSDLTSNTFYLTINSSGSPSAFTTGQNYAINLAVNIRLRSLGSVIFQEGFFSPIRVKYRF